MGRIKALFNEVMKSGAEALLVVENVSEAEKKVRLAVCAACPEFDAEERRCTRCGCFMDVKAGSLTNRNPERALRIEITHCPLGKWGDKEIADYYTRK